jgi:hypothetical protein
MKMTDTQIIDWLLKGDISIQYQVYRDLMKIEKKELKDRIAKEGWGARFLSIRNQNGHWGKSFYQPKWTSTHYTLLDLKNLAISNQNKEIKATIDNIARTCKAKDGGIDPRKSLLQSDVCINGMFLNYACYFGIDETDLKSIVDFLLSQQLKDGGFNCHSNRKGAVHSSLHTTLSVIEGILEYSKNNYSYRLSELKKAEQESLEFILKHKLYQSHKTGETIDPKMLMLSYPSRWRYDILRALDYLQYAGIKYDVRMQDAINILLKKRRTDNRWPIQAKHAGQVHLDMEKPGEARRWNTLRAMRVLKHFGITNQYK